MMNHTHKTSGFTLIEALIGLVVLAVGLLTLANFHTSLLSSSGLSKARTEAINIGQQEIETQRNLILESQYDALADGTRNVTGSNAIFTVTWDITALPSAGTPSPADPERTTVDVTVGWTDAQGAAQSIVLSSIVAWENPALGAVIASQGGPAPAFIPQPQGGADLGIGKTYTDDELAAKGPTPSGNDDGIVTVTNDAGRTELVDTNNSNKVVLTLSDNTMQFSTISGNIYIDNNSSSATVSIDSATGLITSPGYALAPDAAYCTRVGLLDDNGTPDTADDVYGLGTSGTYTYFAYHCYVATDWYGNIGILRIDNSNDEICLGDPTISGDTILASARMYRGFYKSVSSTPGASPVVYDTYPDTGLTIYYSDGIAGGIALTGHHFFILNLSGNPTDSDCVSPMTTASADNGSGGNIFAGLPNDYFCLKPEDDPSNNLGFNMQEMTAGDELNDASQKIAQRECNPVKPGNRIDSATLTGTLNMHGNLADIGDTTVYAESFACAIVSGAYTCTIYFAEGTTWNGDIMVMPGSGIEVCDGTSPLTLTGVTDGTTHTNNFGLCLTSDRTEHTISGAIVEPFGVTSSPVVTTSDGSPCSVDTNADTYTCTVSDFNGTPTSVGSGWSGTITLEVAEDYDVCSSNPRSFTNVTTDLTGNDFTVAATGSCVSTTTSLTITGQVTVSGGTPTTFTGVTLSADSADIDGSCTPAAGSITVGSGGSTTYSCTTGEFDNSTTWTGVVTVTTNKTLCINSGETPTTGTTDSTTGSFTIIGAGSTPATITHNIEIQKSASGCSAGLN